ncbi:hypothetical protein U9M48_001547 [Paspalum notatum var. saurae]|uniref:Reverse transcriptase zinc-binding domain-containing protein n=1 Tax=Paspalum notatum var. saurae TaxID=547442 RepID=A0AAQ3PF07_PASNO
MFMMSFFEIPHLSYGGRLVLLNSVLSSFPMFMMSFFEIPKSILRSLDFYRFRFFWQGNNDKKKYRLARWDMLCHPKDPRGLEINLRIKNKCLLSLLKVREDFLGCGIFTVRDGSQTRFWEDIWVGSNPLKDQFLSLYNIVHYPHKTVLSNGRDAFIWGLHRHGQFSVRSMYHFLIDQGALFTGNFIWNLKIPLKIMIFLWYLHHVVILAKDSQG